MKIRLSELRRLIRTVLREETWQPGRWDPTVDEPISDEDLDLLGGGGFIHDADENEEDTHKSK